MIKFRQFIKDKKQLLLNVISKTNDVVGATNLLYWFKDDNFVNFGDEIGPYLYYKLTGKKARYSTVCDCNNEVTFLTVGSIIRKANCNCIIWGSGIMTRYDMIQKPIAVFAVRGPFTKKRCDELGIPCPAVYGDPALLLPLFFKPKKEKKFKLGIIPHYVQFPAVKKKFERLPDSIVIDLKNDVEYVVNKMLECETIISSSLHGIITSHAYNIPTMHVDFSEGKLAGDGIKFYDYYTSVGLVYNGKVKIIEKNKDFDGIMKMVQDQTAPSEDKLSQIKNNLLSSCPFK